MNTPNSAAKTIPIIGPTLSRFVRTFIARDDEGGIMSVCTDSPVGGIGREAPKVARSVSERRMVNFILIFCLGFCAL